MFAGSNPNGLSRTVRGTPSGDLTPVPIRPITAAAVLLLLFFAGLPLRVRAQETSIVAASDPGLPDAPGFGQSGAAGSEERAQKSSGTISGTVLDPNGGVVSRARIVLTNRTGGAESVQESGANGEFFFAGLPQGTFRLTVTKVGMGTFFLPEIPLVTGESRMVPEIVLPVAALSTEIRVRGDPNELAEEQVHIAVEQRVWGVVPNFYSSYDWNAPPLGPKQKFHLAFRSVSDVVAFAGAGALAGIEHTGKRFPGYGFGMKGYSKRYGAAYASDFSGRMLSSAVLPALFHQDPRYFYRGSGSGASRLLYAIGAALITRSDKGHWQPNYSHVLGSFAAGGLSNLYYPPGSRGVSLTIVNGLIETVGNAGNNILREFVLKGITTKVPSYANGKP